MINGRLDPELSQQTNTADAEHLFLHDTRFGVATVEVAGDHAVDLAVRLDVRIQQIKRNASDLSDPRLCVHLASSNMNRHPNMLAVCIHYRLYREAEIKDVR